MENTEDCMLGSKIYIRDDDVIIDNRFTYIVSLDFFSLPFKYVLCLTSTLHDS